MSDYSVMTTIFKSSPYLVRLSLDLFWMYITLGRRVRKTRKAFEKQLVREGMSKTDARRLSACFEDLENNIRSVLKHGVTGSLRQPRR